MDYTNCKKNFCKTHKNIGKKAEKIRATALHKGKTCDRIIEIPPVNTDALRGPTRTRESEGKSYGTPPNQNDPQSGVSDPEG